MKQLNLTTSYRFKEESPQTRQAKINGCLIGAMLVVMSKLPKKEANTAVYIAESIIEVLDPDNPEYDFIMSLLNSQLERFELYV